MQTWRVPIPERAYKGDEKKLYAQVRRTLWNYEPLRASHARMVIELQGRRVRLTGRVRTLSQKGVAGALVAGLKGVESVSNELVADYEVTRQVADRLAADDRTAPYVIQVESRHGLVYLRGEVPSDGARQAAIDITSQAPLVDVVRDMLTLGGLTFQPYALSRASDPLALAAGAVDAAGATTSAVGSSAAAESRNPEGLPSH